MHDGWVGGRKRALTKEQVKNGRPVNKEMSIKEICKTLKVGRTTLYRYVSPAGDVRQG
jgi:hypothetical protein